MYRHVRQVLVAAFFVIAFQVMAFADFSSITYGYFEDGNTVPRGNAGSGRSPPELKLTGLFPL